MVKNGTKRRNTYRRRYYKRSYASSNKLNTKIEWAGYIHHATDQQGSPVYLYTLSGNDHWQFVTLEGLLELCDRFRTLSSSFGFYKIRGASFNITPSSSNKNIGTNVGYSAALMKGTSIQQDNFNFDTVLAINNSKLINMELPTRSYQKINGNYKSIKNIGSTDSDGIFMLAGTKTLTLQYGGQFFIKISIYVTFYGTNV